MSTGAKSMTSRERVLTALTGGMPDRVPWLELRIDAPIQIALMGGRTDFTPAELCATVGVDGYGIAPLTPPLPVDRQTLNTAAYKQQAWYDPPLPSCRFYPPYIAVEGISATNGRTYVEHPLLKTPADLRLFDEYLPDPDDPRPYEKVQNWLAGHRGEHAVFAALKVGGEDTINCMGLDTAALAVYDDPDFLHAVLARYEEWSVRVIEHVNQLDVDFIVVLNDMADSHGPWFSPDVFREFFLPPLRSAARAIKKPWIYHSDGHIEPMLPDLVPLGMNAIHPLQPPTDIVRVKGNWGDRVCLVGNVDIVETLVSAPPEVVTERVRELIAAVAPGGRYIISSCPVIADFCSVENVRAMAAAIRRYGQYPIALRSETSM